MTTSMNSDLKSVIRRYDKLYAADANWRRLWRELADFTIPRKSNIQVQRSPGFKLTSPLMYDSTAPWAVGTLAAAIHGSLTDPKFLWFGLDFELEDLNSDPDAKQWLEDARLKLAKRIQKSNFDAEIQEVYSEVVAVATGANFVDATVVPKTKNNPHGFGGFRNRALPIGSYVIAEDEIGQVDTLMQLLKITPRAAKAKFGDKNLPDKWVRMLEQPDRQDELVQVLHAVFPREGADKRPGVGTASKRLPWASSWIAYDEKHLLSESGFHEFPFQVVRWTKQAGEMWGRGPGEVALPDVRTLNEAVKLRLQAWSNAVKPPMEAKDRGVVGKPDMRPSAVNYVREMGNLKPIDFGAKFDVANFNEEKLQNAIKQIFFIDKLELPMKSIITATEANQRVRAMQRILGPTLGRLDDELLRRMIVRKWALMLRAGAFDPIPPAVLEAADNNVANIDIRFDGPLARAQREQELEAMSNFIQAVIPLKDVQPDVIDKINFDTYVDEAAKATSLTRLLRPEKQVIELRQKRQQAQADAQASKQQLDAAKAAGQIAPALTALAGPADRKPLPVTAQPATVAPRV